jgi:hypothetical protein
MSPPGVTPRIEQRHQYPGEWIKRTNIRPFVPIAAQTGQGQIVRTGLPAVLNRNDVIRFMLVERDRLRQQTILTPIGGTFGNQ